LDSEDRGVTGGVIIFSWSSGGISPEERIWICLRRSRSFCFHLLTGASSWGG